MGQIICQGKLDFSPVAATAAVGGVGLRVGLKDAVDGEEEVGAEGARDVGEVGGELEGAGEGDSDGNNEVGGIEGEEV